MEESLRTSNVAGTRAVSTKQLQSTSAVTVTAIAVLLAGSISLGALTTVLPYRARAIAAGVMVLVATLALGYRLRLGLGRVALGAGLGAGAVWIWHDLLRQVLIVGYPRLAGMHHHWSYYGAVVAVVLGLSLSDVVKTWRERGPDALS